MVVLDTPPGLGGLGRSALWAADAVVIPAAADYLATHALQGTIESVRSIERDTGRRYAPLVLLPTFVDARRPGAVDATALMRERFGDLVSPDSDPAQQPLRLGRFGGRSRRGGRAALDGRGRLPPCVRRPVARLGRKAPKRHGALKGFVRADMREAFMTIRSHRLRSTGDDSKRRG